MNLKRSARKVLEENRRTTGGHQYTVPSAEHYPYQWLWDSCFHAIILAQYEPDAAKAELRALLSKQFENGLVPHIIYWTPGILHLFRWGVEGTSSLTQPPMIAVAAWEVHRRAPDTDFLKEIFPKLMAYYRFLIDKRDPRDHHLVGIINPDESGEDDSPRFDAPLGVPLDVSYQAHLDKRHELVDANQKCNFDAELCMRNYFWVKDVLFNTVLVENLRVLAHIASLLEHEDDEHYAMLHAGLIADAMRERMFEDGVFWSTTGVDYTKLKVDTWAHFAPLFAGLYSQEEAGRVVEKHLRNEDTFKSPFGIRTVSKKEPAYRATTSHFSWRGTIWFAPHWFIYKGLLRYGFKDDADWIRAATVGLLEKNGFRECFNPETGEAYGAHEFTWGALALDMMEA